MPNKEYWRELLTDLPTSEQFRARLAEGWKPVALEWERQGHEPGTEPAWVEEIPYGLQISDDCMRLVENPAESEVIVAALDMIVADCPLSRVAAELNRRGFQTRDARQWTATALFNLLPRMIQVGPRLFSSDRWVKRRLHLPAVS